MKKRMALILALVVVLVALVGIAFAIFGGGGNKLTIIKEDGTTETMSVKKLVNIFEKDGRTKESYMGCEVSGSGKIVQLLNYGELDGWSTNYDDRYICLDNGVLLYVDRSSDDKDVAQSLYVGDTIEYRGYISFKAHSGSILDYNYRLRVKYFEGSTNGYIKLLKPSNS
ncbi:MAG: hypothetical protein E7450_03425 [Ruminococcaceae bacterium]|nr:hypothetical protein [Oscillospiraceae bacterium]